MTGDGLTNLIRLSLLFLVLILTPCAALADQYPKGFKGHPFNPPGQEPRTESGVTTFHLSPGVCSTTDYGDGRGENDCNNGNLRSILNGGSVALGKAVEYRFDIRIDPSLAYPGFQTMAANGYYPGGIDSGLRIASWEGPFLHNFIYNLKVSTTHGIDFLAKQCQAPADFGKWVSFSMKVKWARDGSGWIKVSCDGKVIYADEGIATNQAPFCWESNQCEPSVHKDPDSFLFILGPVLQGFGPDWKTIPAAKSLFSEIQADGITIQVRNPGVDGNAKLYDPDEAEIVRQLQAALIALGCDPGPADGVSGQKTRDAALSCRKFPEGTLPAKLTVATAKAFLDAYTSPGVADLPKGTPATDRSDGLVAVDHIVHVGEDGAIKIGHDTQVNSNIMAHVKDWKKKDSELFFGLVGTFDYRSNSFVELQMFLQDSLGDKVPPALAACGRDAFLVFPDGSAHVLLSFQRDGGTTFLPPRAIACILAAVPPAQAKRAAFLVTDFADIAVGFIRDKTIAKVRHDGVKIFLERVAKGEISVGGAVN